MSLVDKVNAAYQKAKEFVFLPKNQEQVREYLMGDRSIGNYLNNLNGAQKDKYGRLLDEQIEKSFAKYEDCLGSRIAKHGGKIGAATGVLQLLGRALEVYSGYISGLSSAIIAGKTVMELPAAYNYIGNTQDLNGVYGLAKYGLRKAIGFAVPFVGPVIEGSALRDMIVERVIHEARTGFLKGIGRYESPFDRVKRRVEQVAGPVRYDPILQPA